MSKLPNLTADDWGLSPGINAGIYEIAKLNQGLRVSVMTNENFVTNHLDELRQLPAIRFGLHFDLIRSNRFHRPAEVLKAWLFSHSLERESLQEWTRQELKVQLQKAKDYNLKLTYLDGHQHVHLVPGLFESIADILISEGIRTIRNPLDWNLLWGDKRVIVPLSIRFGGVLGRLGFSTLKFSYPARSAFDHPERLLKSLRSNANREILVHPAAYNDLDDLKIDDGYREDRLAEFSCLSHLLTTKF